MYILARTVVVGIKYGSFNIRLAFCEICDMAWWNTHAVWVKKVERLECALLVYFLGKNFGVSVFLLVIFSGCCFGKLECAANGWEALKGRICYVIRWRELPCRGGKNTPWIKIGMRTAFRLMKIIVERGDWNFQFHRTKVSDCLVPHPRFDIGVCRGCSTHSLSLRLQTWSGQ